MRREHKVIQTPVSEQYLFNFPLIENGVNLGNLPESQYIGNLRNYGSTNATPSFNDNLVFDSHYGELAHRHTNNTDKLVSLLGYNTFDITQWMNNNDWELNLDFYFDSYSGYQQVLEMHRNPSYQAGNNYSVGLDGRYTSTLWLILWPSSNQNDGIRMYSEPPIYVTQSWVRMNVKKQTGQYTTVYTKLSDDTILSAKTDTFPTLITGRGPRYITLFGFYLEGSDANNGSRYTIGATKNFYMKKL